MQIEFLCFMLHFTSEKERLVLFLISEKESIIDSQNQFT